MRKFIGLLGLLAFLIIYIVAAITVAPKILPEGNKILELIYFVAAGFGWIVPARAMIFWIQK